MSTEREKVLETFKLQNPQIVKKIEALNTAEAGRIAIMHGLILAHKLNEDQFIDIVNVGLGLFYSITLLDVLQTWEKSPLNNTEVKMMIQSFKIRVNETAKRFETLMELCI